MSHQASKDLYTAKDWDKVLEELDPASFYGYLEANDRFTTRIQLINNLNDFSKMKKALTELIKETKEFSSKASSNPPTYF